jgi:hypothetical protein
VYGNIGANPQIDKIGIVECCDSFWLLNFVLLIGLLGGRERGQRCVNCVNKGELLINASLVGFCKMIYMRENNLSNNKLINCWCADRGISNQTMAMR